MPLLLHLRQDSAITSLLSGMVSAYEAYATAVRTLLQCSCAVGKSCYDGFEWCYRVHVEPVSKYSVLDTLLALLQDNLHSCTLLDAAWGPAARLTSKR